MKIRSRILAVTAIAALTITAAFPASADSPLNVVFYNGSKPTWVGSGHADIFMNSGGVVGSTTLIGDPPGSAGAPDTFVAAQQLVETFVGRGGADVFRFHAETSDGYSTDTIADFDPAEGDRIDLSRIDANTKLGGRQAFRYIGEAPAFEGRTGYQAAGQLRFWDGYLIGDTNGTWSADGSDPADFELIVKLDGVDHLDAAALVLSDKASGPAKKKKKTKKKTNPGKKMKSKNATKQ